MGKGGRSRKVIVRPEKDKHHEGSLESAGHPDPTRVPGMVSRSYYRESVAVDSTLVSSARGAGRLPAAKLLPESGAAPANLVAVDIRSTNTRRALLAIILPRG